MPFKCDVRVDLEAQPGRSTSLQTRTTCADCRQQQVMSLDVAAEGG